MNRQIRNSRPNQGLHEPSIRQIHQNLSLVASIEIGVALRPGNGYSRDWPAIDQVSLVRLMPAKQGLRGSVHAAVLMVSAHMVPPGLNAAGKTLNHPEASFRCGLAG